METLKRIARNRIALGTSCLAVAAAICFGIAPWYNRALAETREVVVAKTDIPYGAAITPDMLDVITVGAFGLQPGIASAKEQAAGAYAAAGFTAGDYITAAKLSGEPLLADAYLAGRAAGQLALSVTVPSLAAGLSDKLRPGDVVTIIISGAGEGSQTLVPPELTYVEVLAVTDGAGRDMAGDGPAADAPDGQFPGSAPTTVTVVLSADAVQARLLVEAETAAAGLHFALAWRGGGPAAAAYLAEQAAVLALAAGGGIPMTHIIPPPAAAETNGPLTKPPADADGGTPE